MLIEETCVADLLRSFGRVHHHRLSEIVIHVGRHSSLEKIQIQA